MHIRLALVLSALGLSYPILLTAQQPPPLRPGQRVRVTFVSSAIKKQVATVGSLSEGRISLTMLASSSSAGTSARQLTVPFDSLASLEVSRGFRSHPVKGAIIGGIALGVFGGAVGGAWKSSSFFSPPLGIRLAIGAAVGAVGGALAGWGIGSLFRTEQWEPVVLRRADVLVAPQAGGRLGFGASISY